jgi:hypothetical protein
MKSDTSTCFVCKSVVNTNSTTINTSVNLPVCTTCRGSKHEKEEENILLESLADGFVCGCI